VRTRPLSSEQKAAVTASCERFISDILKPRFLLEIRPTTLNYPIDIFGRWRGGKYSFVTRYRSGFPDNAGDEFDVSFTHLDHVDEHLADVRFDVMWHRHAGQWWRLESSLAIEEALRLIETKPLLQPPL
jgi:hypothetical protein